MTEFWLFSGILVLTCAGFIIFPVYKYVSRTRETETSHDSNVKAPNSDIRQKQNVTIFTERVAELEAERDQGKLDQSTFDALKNELEVTLMSDVSTSLSASEASTESQGEAPGYRPVILSFVLAIFAGAISYTTYFQWGAYHRVLDAQAQALAPPPEINSEADIDVLLNRLYTKLKQAPNNIEGWMLLARSSVRLGRYDRAIESYEIVIELFEQKNLDNAVIYGLMAQALFAQAGDQLTVEVEQTLKTALDKDPDEVNSLVLNAMIAYDSGNYANAIRDWQHVIDIAPDHPSRMSMLEGINRAKEALGVAVSPGARVQTPTVEQSNGEAAEVRVKVSLDPQLAGRVKPSDIVFIFAQAQSGPRMPLAASRHTVAELPVSVLLNDSTSMTPMAKLSQVKTANIIARISKSGRPIASPGDLEGRQNGVKVSASESVSIIIDNEL